tara:strand:+ start:5164 stop:6330 length:1167 start_codon:yes stop_codon:yes gene_type:complete
MGLAEKLARLKRKYDQTMEELYQEATTPDEDPRMEQLRQDRMREKYMADGETDSYENTRTMGCPVCGHGLKTISASAECPYCEVLWHYHETDGFSYFEAEIYSAEDDGWINIWSEDFIEGGCVSDDRAILLWELVNFPRNYADDDFEAANEWWESLQNEQREDLLDMMTTNPELSGIIDDWADEDVPDIDLPDDDFDAEDYGVEDVWMAEYQDMICCFEPMEFYEDGNYFYCPVCEESIKTTEFDAESFRDWADDELRTHGENVSFEDWSQEEFEDEPTHRHPNGQLSFVQWARDEMNEEHHNAEEFCAECGCSSKDAETFSAETSSGTQVFNSCWKCGSGQHLFEITRYPATPDEIKGVGGDPAQVVKGWEKIRQDQKEGYGVMEDD